MPIDTGAFIAGVGVLVGFDILGLTAIFALARDVGHDPVARKKADKALKHAREASAEVRTDGGRTRGRARRVHDWLMRLVERVPISFDYRDGEGDTDGRTGFASTYPEVHNLGWGFGHGAALAAALVIGPQVSLAAAAVCARTLLYAYTGREIEVAGRAVELPAKYLKQLHRDPHYFSGALAASTAACLALFEVYGVPMWF